MVVLMESASKLNKDLSIFFWQIFGILGRFCYSSKQCRNDCRICTSNTLVFMLCSVFWHYFQHCFDVFPTSRKIGPFDEFSKNVTLKNSIEIGLSKIWQKMKKNHSTCKNQKPYPDPFTNQY